MIGIGCLLPFVLLIAGAAIGGVVGATPDAIWGGLIGAVVGLIAMLLMLRVFQRARSGQAE